MTAPDTDPEMVVAHANALAGGTSLFVCVNYPRSEAKVGRLCWPRRLN
jgi:hypothetical protein